MVSDQRCVWRARAAENTERVIKKQIFWPYCLIETENRKVTSTVVYVRPSEYLCPLEIFILGNVALTTDSTTTIPLLIYTAHSSQITVHRVSVVYTISYSASAYRMTYFLFRLDYLVTAGRGLLQYNWYILLPVQSFFLSHKSTQNLLLHVPKRLVLQLCAYQLVCVHSGVSLALYGEGGWKRALHMILSLHYLVMTCHEYVL